MAHQQHEVFGAVLIARRPLGRPLAGLCLAFFVAAVGLYLTMRTSAALSGQAWIPEGAVPPPREDSVDRVLARRTLVRRGSGRDDAT